MNPLLYVDVSLYFEVSNSKVYGGEGSVGYTCFKMYDVKNPEGVDEEIILTIKEDLAKGFKVRVEDMRLISKEKYDRETADDEEEGDWDDEEEDDWDDEEEDDWDDVAGG